MKRRDLMVKYSDIINPTYSYMRLIPSSSINNYDSSALAILVNDLFKTLKERIHFFEKRIFLEERTSIRYLIDISQSSVEFFYIIPSVYKDLAIDTIAKMWNGKCTVQEVSRDSIRVLNDPTIYQAKYKYEDSLSLKTDKKSNQFLSKSLNIIEIMGEEDSVQLAVNLIPYKRTPSHWKTYCDDIYDRYKKNLPIHRNKMDFNYFFELLISTLGGFINLILPESLRSTVDFSIAGDKKELSASSLRKARDSKKIIDSQIAVLTKSKDKDFEDTLAKSFCNSFKSISDDNELLGFKTSFEKSGVSPHSSIWNIAVNRMSSDELSNFITIAGQNILKQFKNIEHVATKQVQIIPELSEGIVVLGTQTYKNNTQIQYLNEHGQYANLPIIILTKMGGGKSTWFETVGVSLMNNFRRNMLSAKPIKKESLFCLDFIKQNELSYNIMNNMHPEDIELIDLSTSEGTSKLGLFFKEAEVDENDKRNRLRLASRQGKEMMKLVDYLNEKTSGPLTTPMKRYLSSAFKICYIHSNKSLRDALRIIENFDVRYEYINMIPDELREDLDDEIRALKELDDGEGGTKTNLIGGIQSRTYVLQSDPILKEMYNAKPENGVNLSDAMQKGKGIFILMPDDEFDDEMINIVSTYVISRLFFACQKRGTLNSNELTRCTLLIDEINLAPGCLSTLNDIIGKLRKYKLRPILSAHNFNQINTLKKNLKSVGLSVILPQGTAEENFLEFENYFKKEGFSIDDLQTLKEYETLNLMETSSGKKAFISKFPKQVDGKIEDRDDISVTEFKEMINKKIREYNKDNKLECIETKKEENANIKNNINSKEKEIDFNKKESVTIKEDIQLSKNEDNSEELIQNKNNAPKTNIFNFSSYKKNTSKKDEKKVSLTNNLIDLNDDKYNYLFESDEFQDEEDEYNNSF